MRLVGCSKVRGYKDCGHAAGLAKELAELVITRKPRRCCLMDCGVESRLLRGMFFDNQMHVMKEPVLELIRP